MTLMTTRTAARTITAQEAVPGIQIRVHGVLIRVGRWVGTGQGDAILISDEGVHMGLFERHQLFETR